MQEHEILLRIRRKFNKNEAIAAYANELKKIQFENGLLKSDLAEALHNLEKANERINRLLDEKEKQPTLKPLPPAPNNLEIQLLELQNQNKSLAGQVKRLYRDLKLDANVQKIKELKNTNRQLNNRIVELCVKNYNLEKLQFCNVLPSKDSAVDKGYSISNASEYNKRNVISDTNNDLYYTGWLDCYDWIKNTFKEYLKCIETKK